MFRRKKEVQERHKKLEEFLKQTEELASKYLLTIPATEYVNSVGKSLSDYELRKVDVSYMGESEEVVSNLFGVERIIDLEHNILKAQSIMINKAQKLGAEVVISIRPSIAYHPYYYQLIYFIGTALILKKQKNL